MADGGTAGSTPSNSRTPSPPPAASSCGDWIQPYSNRASPVCSSPDKHTFPSCSAAGQSDQSSHQRPRLDKHTDLAELAKHVRPLFLHCQFCLRVTGAEADE